MFILPVYSGTGSDGEYVASLHVHLHVHVEGLPTFNGRAPASTVMVAELTGRSNQ